jgi:hypothetical protein
MNTLQKTNASEGIGTLEAVHLSGGGTRAGRQRQLQWRTTHLLIDTTDVLVGFLFSISFLGKCYNML